MAVFVIAIHTQPFVRCTSKFFMGVYEMLVSTAVPFFFTASGFLLFEKIDDVNNIKRLWRHLAKITRLYIIWTLLYMPLTIYEYVINGNPAYINALLFIRGTFLTGEHYNSWILWYLLATIYSLLLIGVLLKFNVKIIVIYIISILLFVFGNTMSFLVSNIDYLRGAFRDFAGFYGYLFVHGRLLTGTFYIVTGIIIAKNRRNIPMLISVFILLLGIFLRLYASQLISSLSTPLYSVVLFLMILSMDLKGRDVYLKFRKTSAVFYFFHLMCWSVYTIVILNNPNQCGIDSFVVTLLGCSLIAAGLAVLEKHKIYKWIGVIIQ
jgi:hypothetical protein